MARMIRPLLLFLLVAGTVAALSRPSFVSRREALIDTGALATLGIATSWGIAPAPAGASYIDPSIEIPAITKTVFLDVQTSKGETGRLVIGLFGDLMPKVTDNFVTLCENNKYADTSFYRVISGITVQAGAIGDQTGRTGKSSFGNPFEPDNYSIKHTKEGLVSMARDRTGGVDSRFFINTKEEAGWADDRYAAFGIVQEGMNFVHDKIESAKVKPPQNAPVEPIKIVKSGIISQQSDGA